MLNLVIIITAMESIVSQSKVHFYEFMEIDILHEYIQTGIDYMVRAIVNSNNRMLGLRYYTDEISALLSAIKDVYFLVCHKAIYAEHFYGLERTNTRGRAAVVGEAVVWTVLPYVLRKIQQKFINLKEQAEAGQNLAMPARIFIKVFPVLFCAVKIVTTVTKFRYLMVPQSKYYNLSYWIGRTELGYKQAEQPSPYPILALLKTPGLFLLLIAHKIAGYFFSRDSRPSKPIESASISAPLANKKQKECPICGKRCRNPAVLRTSGYVFCYSCVSRQMRGESKCPVTGLPSDQSQIQIIYQ